MDSYCSQRTVFHKLTYSRGSCREFLCILLHSRVCLTQVNWNCTQFFSLRQQKPQHTRRCYLKLPCLAQINTHTREFQVGHWLACSTCSLHCWAVWLSPGADGTRLSGVLALKCDACGFDSPGTQEVGTDGIRQITEMYVDHTWLDDSGHYHRTLQRKLWITECDCNWEFNRAPPQERTNKGRSLC